METVRRHDPDVEKAILGLWIALEGCIDFLADHDRECDCWLCHDVYGVLWSVNVAEGCLVSHCGMSAELRALANRRYPSVAELAAMLAEPEPLVVEGKEQAHDGQ